MAPSDTPLLTEEQIVAAPESEYMNDDQLAFFKQRLFDLHDATRERIQDAKDAISEKLDISDENDRATWEEQCAISLRIADREQKLLPKIKEALARIRDESYGYCLESGEPIGIPRLLLRPTAEFCVDVKSVKEIKETNFKE